MQLIEQHYIDRGFKSGGLCDLSAFAPDGFPKQIAATTALWRSLLWAYPSSQIADFIGPENLLRDIKLDFFGPFEPCPEPFVTPFTPLEKPSWLPKTFAIAVYDHPAVMLLALPEETFPFAAPAKPIVPAGLIVKITRLLASLSLVARFHETIALRKLVIQMLGLAKRHPLEKQIRADLAAYSPSLPENLSNEQYRRILVGELEPLLEIALSCDLDPVMVSLLSKHYEMLRSPLNELVHVARELLLLAAAVPRASRTSSPIHYLASTYSTLSKMFAQSDPNVSKRVLKALENDCVVISRLLPADYAEQLVELRQTLAVIKSIADAFLTGVSYPPQFHLYH